MTSDRWLRSMLTRELFLGPSVVSKGEDSDTSDNSKE